MTFYFLVLLTSHLVTEVISLEKQCFQMNSTEKSKVIWCATISHVRGVHSSCKLNLRRAVSNGLYFVFIFFFLLFDYQNILFWRTFNVFLMTFLDWNRNTYIFYDPLASCDYVQVTIYHYMKKSKNLSLLNMKNAKWTFIFGFE